LGNRGRAIGALIFVALGATLAGCSASDSSVMAAASGTSIGQQALAFTLSGSSTGWSSSASCPDALKQGILSGAQAGTTVVEVDAGSLSGVPADPDLTSGDIVSCAFQINVSSQTADLLVFMNMGLTYQSAIVSKLQADGFLAEAATTNSTGSVQKFDNGTAHIAIQKASHDGTTAFTVIG
jgi:hypothetical protein